MNNTTDTLRDADRCVFCGLCLPHCPTYALEHCETESPRGRISLIQGLLRGELEPDEALAAHLDHCLVCRACEQMCPSKVPYGRLIDTIREQQLKQGLRQTPASLARLLEAVADGNKLQKAAAALRLYQQSGLQRLARGSGLLKGLGLEGLEQQLPQLPPAHRLAEHYPARGERRGAVGLFRGCIGGLLEGEIHQTAIDLLTRLGFEVYVPKAQGCCGSLHLHHGQPDKAAALAAHNRAAFAGLPLDALVGSAAGCVAQLLEYPQQFEQQLGAPVFEICDFLAEQSWPDELRLRPQPQRVALHLPCSQRNVLRRPDAVRQLLQRVPELQLVELAGNEICCGAAGSYLLTQPERAAALRERKRQAFRDSGCDKLISNNIGCSSHIAGDGLEVFHPLSLIQIM